MNKASKIAVAAVTFPLVLGYAKIVRHVPLKRLRVKGGELQTPVVHYEHAETGRKIVFIGMMHVGEWDYYDKVQTVIDSSKGHKVLYEQIGKLSEDEEATFDDRDRCILDKIKGVGYFMTKVCGVLNLKLQKGTLSYGDNSVNTDLSMFDLVKMFAERDLDFGTTEEAVDRALDGSDEARWLLNKVLVNFVAGVTIGWLVSLVRSKLRKEMKIIIGDRNKIALEYMSAYAPTHDIVSVWGSGHFPQIDKGIRKMGYKEVKKEWLTAYRDRNYKFPFVKAEVKRVEA